MMKRIPFIILFFALSAGCSTNTTFVYKPGAPVAGVRKLPLKVAVLPFKDATEDFTKRGNELSDQEHLMYNLAKAGWWGVITALTPELWAKAFADDLASSGRFQGVRFLYTAEEMVDEELRIEGTLEKVSLAGVFNHPNDFSVAFRALRKAADRPVWEKSVTRKWIIRKSLYAGYQGYVNRAMQEMFAEAAADLAETLGASPGSRGGADDRQPAPSPAPSPDSTDGEIERILKGN